MKPLLRAILPSKSTSDHAWGKLHVRAHVIHRSNSLMINLHHIGTKRDCPWCAFSAFESRGCPENAVNAAAPAVIPSPHCQDPLHIWVLAQNDVSVDHPCTSAFLWGLVLLQKRYKRRDRALAAGMASSRPGQLVFSQYEQMQCLPCDYHFGGRRCSFSGSQLPDDGRVR